jgi:hypothetical protein
VYSFSLVVLHPTSKYKAVSVLVVPVLVIVLVPVLVLVQQVLQEECIGPSYQTHWHGTSTGSTDWGLGRSSCAPPVLLLAPGPAAAAAAAAVCLLLLLLLLILILPQLAVSPACCDGWRCGQCICWSRGSAGQMHTCTLLHESYCNVMWMLGLVQGMRC